jgi:hypothetical protein
MISDSTPVWMPPAAPEMRLYPTETELTPWETANMEAAKLRYPRATAPIHMRIHPKLRNPEIIAAIVLAVIIGAFAIRGAWKYVQTQQHVDRLQQAIDRAPVMDPK